MLLISHLLIAVGLGLAAGAPSKSYHGQTERRTADKEACEYT